MHPAFFVGLLITAILASVAQELIFGTWDWRALLGYTVAYTVLLIVPQAIKDWLKRE